MNLTIFRKITGFLLISILKKSEIHFYISELIYIPLQKLEDPRIRVLCLHMTALKTRILSCLDVTKQLLQVL